VGRSGGGGVTCQKHPHSLPETAFDCRMREVNKRLSRELMKQRNGWERVVYAPPMFREPDLTRDEVPVMHFFGARRRP